MIKTRPRRHSLWLGLILVVFPQILSVAFFWENFPFTPFPMYSGTNPGTDVALLQAWLVTPSGEERSFEEVVYAPPRTEYEFRFDVDRLVLQGPQEEDLKLLGQVRAVMARNLEDAGLGGRYSQLRFYVAEWTRFIGPRRHQPDRRTLVWEGELP